MEERIIRLDRSVEADTFVKAMSGQAKELGMEENFINRLEELKGRAVVEMPAVTSKYNMVTKEHDGSFYCEVSKDDSYEKIVLYLHGGAYVFNMDQNNFTLADRLLDQVNAKIVIPAYPLAPVSTYKDAFSFISFIYDEILEENKEVIIMGDSAGAGLSLAFTMYLNEQEKKRPDKAIFISPWFDVTMTNPGIQEYVEKDEILSIFELVTAGNLWAGDISPKDYKISPIYGDFDNMPDVLVFVGTAEVMLPDAELFFESVKGQCDKAWMVYGEDMFHDFAVFPVPEAVKAAKIMAEFIAD